MGIAKFIKGVEVEIEGHPFKLLREFDVGMWQLENQRTGRIQEYSMKDLQRLYVNKKLIFFNDNDFHLDQRKALETRNRNEVALVKTSPEQLEMIKVKKSYVLAVIHLPMSKKMMEPAILQVWKKLGENGMAPHWSTVYRWKKKYLNDGNDAHALNNMDHRKGNRLSRYPEQVKRMVEICIDQQYLTRERKTVAETLTHAIVMVERENKTLSPAWQLPLPTRRYVQSLINQIDAFDEYAARNGNLAAVKKFRTVVHMNVTDKPLECAEIDHTLIDIMVVDAKTGMPWGRPWLTVCVDRRSRCTLGIYIGFEPPSYLSVARCLKHAFLPKVNLKESYPEIVHEWPAFGIMHKLIVDNGLEFHSKSLESVCLALDIDLQYTPRKTPWWKGIVERLIGTINREIAHGNPGTTFSNIFEKGDYDPVKHAVISLDTLKIVLHKWVADVYHQKPHSSLDGFSPAEMWTSNITPEEINIPANPEILDAILGTADSRTLTHKGIEYDNLFYSSKEMHYLKRRKGVGLKVEIRVDEGDLGHIYVIDPDDEQIFKVECVDFEYAAGLTSWQHSICKRYAKNHNLSKDANGWRHAKVAISEIIQREIHGGKKRKTNARVARFLNASTKTINLDQQIQTFDETSIVETESPHSAKHLPISSGKPKKFNPIIETRKSEKITGE